MMAEGGESWDGRVSIEHQLDIHIRDLLQCGSYGGEVGEVLVGLQYVMDYRLRGHQQRNLDAALCDSLVRALLLFTGLRVRTGLFGVERRPSDSAEMAFALLADFCAEVAECSKALLAIPAEETGARLRLGDRLLKPASPAIFAAALSLLHVLTAGAEWRDFFNEDDHDDVYERLEGARYFSTEHAQPRTTPTVAITIYPPPALYFDRAPSRILDMFQTQLEGLAGEEVASLRGHYGSNALPVQSERPIWQMFISQFADVMILILMVTTAVSAITDYPRVESTIILGLVVMLNISVGFWQELRSSRTVAAMRSLQIPPARVRREGKEAEIPSTELVPGDIVILGEGDFVPADLRLIQTSRLEINEVILTGEPVGVGKSNKPIRVPSRKLPLGRCRGTAFMSTMVTRGTGVGVVVRTGAATEIGKIGAALNSQPNGSQPSPLQRQMARLGKMLVVLVVLLCALVFGLGMLQGEDVDTMIRLSVSLAVSVIPEGLVAILTVGMALAVRRLARMNVLVRRLNAVETLGCTSVVAADKTGTLTEGRMRMETLWTMPSPDDAHDLAGANSTSAGELDEMTSIAPGASAEKLDEMTSSAPGASAEKLDEMTCLALSVSVLCNNATADGVGEPTEVALMRGAAERGFPVEATLLQWQRQLEIPFDSERRMMTIVAADGQAQTAGRLATAYVKGAAEAILGKCTTMMLGGRYVRLDGPARELIGRTENEFSDRGLRVLALATRRDIDLSKAPAGVHSEELVSPTGEPGFSSTGWFERDLTFVGLACLLDPPREGVADAVATLHSAGIKVCMITGDHVRTAMAIAGRLGIYRADDQLRGRVMKGTDLDLLSVDALASLQPFPSVFARVSPSNKLAIVQALQQRSEKVAMTGDGVNDAPAVRQADVGVAMGRGGTQITRDAASIILLDDNLTSMVSAVSQGRQMYRNVALFIIYLLSCNSAEIWTVLGAVLLGWEAPLQPMAILWANVIADIPPSMCLSLERDPRDGDLMRTPPGRIEKTVLGWATWMLIIWNGLVLSGATLLIYWLSRDDSLRQRRSEAFLVLIGLQLILALLSRSPRRSIFRTRILGNPWMLAAVVLSFGLLVAGLYVPFLYKILDLEPVGWRSWMKFGISAVTMTLANELCKLLIRCLRL